MEKIKLHDKIFRPYILNDEIAKDVERVAAEINRDFAGCTDVPVIICTLNGAIPFTSEVFLRLKFDCELTSLKVSSYTGTTTTGNVVVKQPLTANVKGRRVIIIEDIVDTGYTMRFMEEYLHDKGATDVRICTLFYKPESFKFKDEMKIDYIGREIQNQFIVGFGLDYDELGRNFRDIYILDE